MAETYTTRLRAVQQEYNSNPETWGTELNIGGLEIIDKGWGTTEVAVNGNVTLTVANKVADQARGFTLILTGAGGFTVTTPAVDKPYYVINNCAADVSVKPVGGTTATVRAGTGAFYYTNAAGSAGNVVDPTLDKIKTAAANVSLGNNKLTNVAKGTVATDVATLSNSVSELALPAAALAMNGQKITGLADPTSAQDAVTKSYIDTLLASTSLGTVAAIAPQIVTVAGISSQVTTVAGISSNVTTVAGISGNVTTVAGISSNVTAVAGNAANITTVANNIGSVNTVAANVTSVTNFGNVYYPASATDPTTRPDGSSRQAGDLYFNTVGNSLRVWSGSNWIPITSVTLASQAQAEAGTDNATVMTPLRTAQAITAQVVPAGRRTFTATGTLPNGAAVVLNSDGTISTVTSNPDTLGTATVFRSASTTYIASAALSATQVVVCYFDGSNAQAVIGTISGTSVSFGTPVTFAGSGSTYISVCALSATSFCVAWYLGSASARVGSVSGTTITFPTAAATFNAATTAFISIAPLSSTAVVIAYQDTGNSSNGTAIIGTISGTTITFGSEYVFSGVSTSAVSVCALSGASFAVAFAVSTGQAIIGTVSGTIISYGTGVIFDSTAGPAYTSIVALTSTSFLVAWARGTTDGRAKIGTVSGTAVSFPGSDAVFKSSSVAYVGAAKLSGATALLSYRDGTSSYGALCLATISGSSISPSTEIVFRSASTSFVAPCAVSSAYAFIGHQDGGNSNYGTGVVFQPAATNVANWIGITAQSIANGASGTVTILGGANPSVSGLTTGATYYLANDGSLTTTQTSYKAGRALSATSLLITGSAQ